MNGYPQVYLKDEWTKKHPLFDGLPCGGLMDYTFYREIIPDWRYWGQEIPEEPVAGAFRNSAAGECHSELMLSVYNLGAGRFILNSLRVRQELGRDPAAERLLRNMLRYAARDAGKAAVATQRRLRRIAEADRVRVAPSSVFRPPWNLSDTIAKICPSVRPPQRRNCITPGAKRRFL